MALVFDVPLVFYGENEAEYGNPIADTSTARRDWSYFTSNDPGNIFLGGASLAELRTRYGLNDNDLLPTCRRTRPSREERSGRSLPRLLPEVASAELYYYAVEHGGFEASPERTPGTYSKYNSIDDRIDDFHY